jgi:hypothetical protein
VLAAVCIGAWGALARAAEPSTARGEAMREAIQERMAEVRAEVGPFCMPITSETFAGLERFAVEDAA